MFLESLAALDAHIAALKKCLRLRFWRELADNTSMRSKQSLCEERGRLVDEQFRGTLLPSGSARIVEIDAELDRRDAPRLAQLKERDDAKLAEMDRQLAELEAKITMEKNAKGRPQTKTAGSH